MIVIYTGRGKMPTQHVAEHLQSKQLQRVFHFVAYYQVEVVAEHLKPSSQDHNEYQRKLVFMI